MPKGIPKLGINKGWFKKIEKPKIQCPVCSDVFEQKRKKQIFCSHKCAFVGARKRIIKICQKCRKEYQVSLYRSNKTKYCSRKCHNSSIEGVGGKMSRGISRNKGTKHPWLGQWNKLYPRRGEKNPAWRGGITPLTRRIRHCLEYRQWQSAVFTKDNFTCQVCSKRGGWLEVDHYPKKFTTIFCENKIQTIEQALGCEEFWNVNNGRVLCLKCHRPYIRKITRIKLNEVFK